MANEKRLIDANAFQVQLEEIRQEYLEEDTLSSNFAAEVIETVQDEYLAKAPTVDAVEVVHGRWVKHKPKPEVMRAWHRQGIGKAMSEKSIFWTCSCCEEWGTPRYNYCPNCGAKMDGGNEDG